jgi:NAD+ kinase
MKIAIHGRNFADPIKPFIQGLFDFFAHKNITLQLSAGFAELLASSDVSPHTQNVYHNPSELFDANFVVTVGGDGTLLDAVTHVGGRGIPILGINTGRLGFLATISPKDIQNSLALVFQKQFTIEERSLLNLDTGSELFGEANFALNDVVITKTDISSMITIHTYLDGDFLNSYWADGLIISTPTGSTGYSLSCGGPVLLPHNSNFIITPISPHNLNVRPMIIPDSSQLSCKIESRSNNFLVSLDSRFKIIETSVELHIKKEAFNARLVKMPQDNFIETLRTKLHWGLDARN